MRLDSSVDLTGIVNMIEEFSLGWDWTRGPLNPQPGTLTSAPSIHVFIWNLINLINLEL